MALVDRYWDQFFNKTMDVFPDGHRHIFNQNVNEEIFIIVEEINGATLRVEAGHPEFEEHIRIDSEGDFNSAGHLTAEEEAEWNIIWYNELFVEPTVAVVESEAIANLPGEISRQEDAVGGGLMSWEIDAATSSVLANKRIGKRFGWDGSANPSGSITVTIGAGRTFSDATWNIKNDRVVVEVGLYSDVAITTFTGLILQRRTTGPNPEHDVIKSETFEHTGTGWEFFEFAERFVVPVLGVFRPAVHLPDETTTDSNLATDRNIVNGLPALGSPAGNNVVFTRGNAKCPAIAVGYANKDQQWRDLNLVDVPDRFKEIIDEL